MLQSTPPVAPMQPEAAVLDLFDRYAALLDVDLLDTGSHNMRLQLAMAPDPAARVLACVALDLLALAVSTAAGRQLVLDRYGLQPPQVAQLGSGAFAQLIQ